MSDAIEFPIDGTFRQAVARSYPDFESSTSLAKGQNVQPVQGAMGTQTQLVEKGSQVQHVHPEGDFRWNQEMRPASQFPGDYPKPSS